MASIALILVALLAGANPLTTPTPMANAAAAIGSQNGMLENLSGSLRDQTEATLHKVYYDILINSDEKYRRLKEVDNDSSNEDESEG